MLMFFAAGLYQEKPILIFYQYLDKRLFVQLNGSRKVIGVLRGYDVCYHLSASVSKDCCSPWLYIRGEKITHIFGQVFLNVVLDDAVEEKDGGEKVKLGMVVSSDGSGCCGYWLAADDVQ